MTKGASPAAARCALMSRTTQSMMVRVRSPRKSNLTRPAASTSSLSNCVTGVLLPSSQYSGVKSVRTDGAMTTPPACVPAFRARPSSDARQIDQLAHFGFALVQAPQFLFLLERLVERHADFQRNQLGDLVHVAVRMTEHAADVAHHRFGGQGAVGDDLRNAVAAVLVGDILDDPVAAFHAEVDVEIRHRHALRIQESLEQQIMLDGIQIGDAQRIGDQRTRAGTAARAHRHAVLARPADEIGDDQEVSGEAHGADDAEFQLQTRLVGRDARRRGRHALPRPRGGASRPRRDSSRRKSSVLDPAGTG